jgi:hypothetical protein
MPLDQRFPFVTLTAVSLETTSGHLLAQEALVSIACSCAGVVFAVGIMAVHCRPSEPQQAVQVTGPCWVHPDTGVLVEGLQMLAPADLALLNTIAMRAAWKWVCDVMGWGKPL